MLSKRLQQDIGKGGKPQPQLIALKLMGGGAVTEQIELMFLNAVFSPLGQWDSAWSLPDSLTGWKRR